MTYVPQVKNNVGTQNCTVGNPDYTPFVTGNPGDGMAPMCDYAGRLVVFPVTPFGPVENLPIYDPQAIFTDDVIVAAPAQLYEFRGYNPNAATIWIQTYDTDVAPVSGVTQSFGVDLLVPPMSSFMLQIYGLFYATGLAWGCSETAVVYTNTVPTEARFIARYGA